jgi:predicted phosphodiesterase
MKYVVLGDVHGNLRRCDDVARRNSDKLVIQIGDLGVGFMPINLFDKLPRNFRFFCGNHDCRTLAHKLKAHLGDFGEFHDVFYISGADSIDRGLRTEGIDWWPDEELTYAQGQKAIEQWAASKAKILLSHDLPQSLAESHYLIYDRSRTRTILQAAIEARKPEMVVYGHHHKSFRTLKDGVTYVGLAIDEAFEFQV